MFADGKIQVIRDDTGDLFINMWELVGHLMNSAEALEDVAGPSDISNTMRVIVSTLCDLAMYELGLDTLNEFNNVDELVNIWERYRE